MKHLILRLLVPLGLGLGLMFGFMGLMHQLGLGVLPAQAADLTVCLAGPPTCAYTNVQAAVDAAVAGDVIKVAAGTYTGVYTRLLSLIGPPRVFTQMVYISKSVTIRGGYTSAFTEPANPQTNLTTLDAQGQGRVALIDYLASPTIEGLRLRGGDARKSNIIFSSYDGGGLLIVGGPTVLSGNIIIDNQADSGGGLSVLFFSGAALTNNIIAANTALNSGGGINVVVSASVSMSGNQILSNTARNGGGVFFGGINSPLNGNIIRGNQAEKGGGLYGSFDHNGNGVWANNLVADNQATIAGSGLYIVTAGPSSLLHTTIAHNTGGDGSGIYIAYYFAHSRLSLTNTILMSQTVGITVAAGATVTLESTLWHGNSANWAGAGTITSHNDYAGDPAFLNPAEGDYHLAATSAAIDQGINTGISNDIDGEARPYGDAVDLGADEWVGAIIPIKKFLPIVVKE